MKYKQFSVDISIDINDVNTFLISVLRDKFCAFFFSSMKKLTQSATVVGGGLVDNWFMCCYYMKYTVAHE